MGFYQSPDLLQPGTWALRSGADRPAEAAVSRACDLSSSSNCLEVSSTSWKPGNPRPHHGSLAGEIPATTEGGRGLLHVLWGVLGTGGRCDGACCWGVCTGPTCDRVSLVLGAACRLVLLLLLRQPQLVHSRTCAAVGAPLWLL